MRARAVVRQPMKHPHRLLHLSILLLCLAVAAAILAGFQEPHGPIQRLPDGTTLELIGVTYGRHHVIGIGNWYHRTLGPWWSRLTARLAEVGLARPDLTATSQSSVAGGARVEGYRAFFDSSVDEPVLWFRVLAGPDSDYVGEGAALQSATIDRHGCRIRCIADGRGGLKWAFTRDWTRPFAVAEVTNYPRRESAFDFALFAGDPSRPVACFRLSNPCPLAPTRIVQPEPRPVATADGVTFAIDKLVPGSVGTRNWNAAIQYHATIGGKPSHSWRVERLTVSDGTGNRVTGGIETGTGLFRFAGLCRYEPYWSVEAELANDDPLGRDANYIWHFRHLPAPASGKFIPWNAPPEHGDGRCRAIGVGGPGQISCGYFEYTSSNPQMAAKFFGSEPLRAVVRTVNDEFGHSIRVVPRVSTAFGPPLYIALFELPRLGSARAVDVEVRATRNRRVKFVLAP